MNQATIYVWDEKLVLARSLQEAVRDGWRPLLHVRDPGDARMAIAPTARGVCILQLPTDRCPGWELLGWLTAERRSIQSFVVLASPGAALAAMAWHLGARAVLSLDDCPRLLPVILAEGYWLHDAS